MSKKPPWPLPNKMLHSELVNCHEHDQLSDFAAMMFELMIDKLSWRLPYKDLELKRDVRSWSLYVCAKNWRKYDVTRGNAFSFFTTTINNGLREGFKRYTRGKTGNIHISFDTLLNSQNTE